MCIIRRQRWNSYFQNKRIVLAQTRICPWEPKNSLWLWDTIRLHKSGQKTKRSFNLEDDRNCYSMDFALPVDYRMKIKETEKIIKCFKSCKRADKAVKYKDDDDTNDRWRIRNNPKGLGKLNGGTGNPIQNRDDSNNFFKIGQNTQKTWGELLPFRSHLNITI